MTFTPDMIDALKAPLDRAAVSSRKQGGTQVSYIAGWHAIAEANRIFGFDGWTRETIDLRQLGEPREVNGNQRVDYMARVRITVGDIIRDGCGFGQGIDKDVGQAHESALKEAETDAMKRAMMTFGNPFGLALYDKTQSNVADILPETDRLMLKAIDDCHSVIALGKWSADHGEAASASGNAQAIRAAYKSRLATINATQQHAA